MSDAAFYDPLTAAGPGQGQPHAPSYWAATAGPPPDDDGELIGDGETDVAIIGGGYTGLSAALHLAENGVRATVLEANPLGWGCSGRNGGFVTPSVGRMSTQEKYDRFGKDGAARLHQESMSALELVKDLAEKHRMDCDLQQEGSVYIAHKPSSERMLRAQTDGGEWLEAADIRRRFFQGNGVGGGVWTPDSFVVHPLKLVNGYARAARASGARVHCRSPVISLRTDKNGCLLTTPKATLRARRVIFAANGYAGEKLAPSLAGRTLPVLSAIIVTRPMTADEKEAINFYSHAAFYDTRRLRRYYRQLPDGRILMGGRGAITATADGLRRRYASLLASVKTLFPPLTNMETEYAWAGWINITWDKMPHIARLPDAPAVIIAMGYNGSGVSYATLAGKHAAAMAMDAPSALPPMVGDFLPRFPLPAGRRFGQRLLFGFWTMRDEWGRF